MIRFGEYFFDVKQGLLINSTNNEHVAVESKLCELIELFIEQPNTIISRQDILERLWEGSLVTDNAINKLIGNLRKLLGDNAKNPRYIQTIPKRGYRLICNISEDNIKQLNGKSAEPFSKSQALTPHDNNSLNIRLKVLFKTLLLILLVVFLWQLLDKSNGIESAKTSALTRATGTENSPLIHPNGEYIYYLSKKNGSSKHVLWLQNIETTVTKRIHLDHDISQLIAVTESSDELSSEIYFLEEAADKCAVYKSLLPQPTAIEQSSEHTTKLFDCDDKRIKDINLHPDKSKIYYTAQPQNYWPNQIYLFDIEKSQHSVVTQPQPEGWGHHSIDISPDGEKLLVMTTNSDYKTQLLSLNLLNNEVIEGVKFDKPAYEAIWHHDSEQVFYFSSPPVNSIMRSELNGDNAVKIVNTSEELTSKLTRVSDGANLLFSTERKNFSIRWLSGERNEPVFPLYNSTVSDSFPALFHSTEQYLFVSKRSGRMQLYLASHDYEQARVVTNFRQEVSLRYLAISIDDSMVLVNIDNKVFGIPINELNVFEPLAKLNSEYLLYESETPIIALGWLTQNHAAITVVNHGNPELVVVNLSDKKKKLSSEKWAYGFLDSQNPNNAYLIEGATNTLFLVKASTFNNLVTAKQISAQSLQISLPTDFYSVKVDNENLYFLAVEAGNEYLNVKQLDNSKISAKYLLNDFSSYDVSNDHIMVSDVESLEGDIHRTIH